MTINFMKRYFRTGKHPGRHVLLFLALLTALTGMATAQHRHGDDAATRSKTFTVEKGGRLVVSVDGGDIAVNPSEKDQVVVNVYNIDEDDLENLRIKQSGNMVRVENESGCGGCDARYEIQVPARFDVELRTSEGEIEIASGLNGSMIGRTSAGNVKLGDEEGSADMVTSGGNIHTGNMKGDMTLSTSGGNLVLGAITGDADVSTSGGDIRIENIGKMLSAHTSGGDVHIGDVGGEADVSTSGGTIIVGKVGGKATLSTAGGDIEIASASGFVSAKTAGGNLELDNITGSIAAKTAGGDIVASLIPSGTGKSRLVTAAGDIQLYIPETSHATINARIRVSGGGWGDIADEYHIRSDFKAEKNEVSEDEDEINATYILNGGGESITLETSNADIHIRKMDGTPKTRQKK